MNSHEMLSHWSKRGITLWEDEGQLRYRAPRGTVTPSIVAELRAHKSEILEQLRTQHRPQPQPGDRFEPFPLTDVQGSYLMGRSLAFDYGNACHLYCEVEYPQLDPTRTTQAWRTLVKRHDMLRVQVDPSGFQRVLPEVCPLQVPVTTVPSSAPEEHSRLLKLVREQLSHAVHSIGSWPMFAVELTQPPIESLQGVTIMHISWDFLVGDWASLLTLIREWEDLYAGQDACADSALQSRDSLQFRDFVLWERAQRESQEYRRARDYWLRRVESLPLAPQIPHLGDRAATRHCESSSSDSAVPTITRGRWRGRSFFLPHPQWEALKKRAQRRRLTPTAVVMACYADVLSRWAQDPHFCLNLTVLDRPPELPQLANIIGDFTSISLLEIHSDTRAFELRARQMLEQLFTDLDHRSFSAVDVMREITRVRGREAATMPYVFTSAIGLRHQGGQSLSAVHGTISFSISQTPQALLDCQVMDDIHGLHLQWDAREDTLPESMLVDMWGAFTNALQALANDEQAWKASSPVDLPLWQRQEREQANSTQRTLPTGLLHEFVIEAGRATPTAPAILGPDVQVSYEELLGQADTIAAALRQGGIRRGDRVAIAVPKSAQQVAAVLGTLIAGAAYVPLDLRHPRSRLVTICEDAQVKALLYSGALAGEDTPRTWVAERVLTVDVEALATPLPPSVLSLSHSEADPTDFAYIIYTSGSTGRPKGVALSHQAVVNTIMAVNDHWKLSKHDRTLAIADLSFDLSVYDIFGPLSVGAAVVLPMAENLLAPSAWLDVATAHRVTTMNTVPALAHLLLASLTSGATRPETFRLWILSGERVGRDLVHKLQGFFPNTKFVAMGGATEAAIWSVAHTVTPNEPTTGDIPYGFPLANQQVTVLDALGRDAPTGVPGELAIMGTGLAEGYSGPEGLVQKNFITDPVRGRMYRTGDRGFYLPGGEIAILNRLDDQIKIRGHRIELGEIESTLNEHEVVEQAAVVVAGSDTEPYLHAFAVPAPTTDDDLLLQWAAEAAAEASTRIDVSDREGITDYAAALKSACIATLTRTLDLVHSGLAVAPQYEWVVDTWQRALQGHETPLPTDRELQSLWDCVGQRNPNGFDYQHFTGYVRQSAEQLPALLSGQVAAHELLFPGGSPLLATHIYQDWAATRWGNMAATALVSRLASHHYSASQSPEPFRVLEIGAGTGSTTSSFVQGLSTVDFQYTFTDQSEYLLTAARRQWGQDARWRFETLDIDEEPTHQGFTPGSYDLVCAFGVLENAYDVPQSLQRMAELTADGGTIILSEPVEDQWWVYVSQIFLMRQPAPGSRYHFTLFPPARWWVSHLQGSTGGTVLTLPTPESPLTAEKVALFATRPRTRDTSKGHASLTSFLRNRLPAVMLPQRTDFVPELPLTGSGKIDRRALAASINASAASINLPRVRPQTFRNTALTVALSKQAEAIAARMSQLWAEQLNLAQFPALSDNPFELGANSISAAAVAGRIRDQETKLTLSFETVLRIVLSAPTIGAAAQDLEQASCPGIPTQAEGSPTLITLLREPAQTGSTFSRVTVLLGDLLTDTVSVGSLAAAIPTSWGPIVAVTVPDDTWFTHQPVETVTDTIATMATASLVEMDADEYCLIGYSYGALVAIEIARCMLEAERRLLPLGLIDPHIVPVFADDRLSELMFLTAHGAKVAHILPDEPDTPTLHEIFDWVRHTNDTSRAPQSLTSQEPTLSAGRVEPFLHHLSSLSERQRWQKYCRALPPTSPESTPEQLRNTWLRYRHAMQAATVAPEPLVTDAVIVQPSSSYGFLPGAHKHAARTWRELLIGTVELTHVAGNHFTMLTNEHIDGTAEPLIGSINTLMKGRHL